MVVGNLNFKNYKWPFAKKYYKITKVFKDRSKIHKLSGIIIMSASIHKFRPELSKKVKKERFS